MKIILIIFGLLLIFINLISLKDKKKKSVESSFREIFSDEKENIDDYKVELGKVRRELSETIIELQRDIYDLKDEINMLKINKKLLVEYEKNLERIDGKYIDKIVEDNINSIDNNLEDNENLEKALMVKKLLKEKKSEDEICNSLNIGKGELLLIKNLYKY